MKKLNNKGITTIEVIVSFVIVVIITASLYTTVSNYNQKRLLENYKSKIYTYKNTLTKEIQDDFIKIGLTHATYDVLHEGPRTTHIVICDLKDGTKRKLEVMQQFTKSTYHDGDGTVDDEFMIKYGECTDNCNSASEVVDVLEYPIPNLGQSITDKIEEGGVVVGGNKITYDLSINNVLISIEDENILSIYIGFYHPELMTRYGINVVCPIDFISKGVDSSGKFNVVEVQKATKRYTFNNNGGAGTIPTIAATVGQPFNIPNKGIVIKEGYTLIGWNTQSDGSGTEYDLGQTVVPASNQIDTTNLFAQWEKIEPVEYNYSGSSSAFSAPVDGRYKLEVWGASGGGQADQTKNSHAGLGGYTVAEVNLQKDDMLYVVVGGAGSYGSGDGSIQHAIAGGYNGGGATHTAINGGSGSGGGATHIAQVNGLLKNLSSSKDKIIIVAGGGGGSDNKANTAVGTSDDGSGGSGGGSSGQNAFVNGVLVTGTNYFTSGTDNKSGCGLGGTQDKGFAFGLGESATAGGDTGGAGGGWYGGYTTSNDNGGGAGGSGYINFSKVISGSAKMYCYGCPSSGDTIITTTYSTTATSQKAKYGNGYAKITFISDR